MHSTWVGGRGRMANDALNRVFPNSGLLIHFCLDLGHYFYEMYITFGFECLLAVAAASPVPTLISVLSRKRFVRWSRLSTLLSIKVVRFLVAKPPRGIVTFTIEYQWRIQDFPLGGGGGGADPLGGCQPPMRTLFGKNVCENERNWSCCQWVLLLHVNFRIK